MTRRHRTYLSVALAASMILATSMVRAQTGASTADLPTVSGPFSLSDAVQTALKNSPIIRSAASQASAAEARVGMARSMSRPQVSATAFAGHSTMGDIIASPPNVAPTGIFTVPDRTGVTGQVGLMLPIYTGGRTSNAVRSARAASTATASDRASTERDVTLQAKMAYHRALLTQATVSVYCDLVSQAQERVRTSEAAFTAGRIARYDLLRNQSALADAEQQLANSERDAQVAMLDLKTALGISAASGLTLKDSLEHARITGTVDIYMDSALKNRPELAAARARVESANSGVSVTRGAYRPQVYGQAMEGVSASSGRTDTGFTVGITAGIPILDGGQRRSAVRESEAMLESARSDERQALLVVQQDVGTAWAEVQAAEKSVDLSEAAVTQAEEDYRVVRLRYEAGKAVNVEVLDALAALTRARNNRLMALYEHNIARDRLARAIGEL